MSFVSRLRAYFWSKMHRAPNALSYLADSYSLRHSEEIWSLPHWFCYAMIGEYVSFWQTEV